MFNRTFCPPDVRLNYSRHPILPLFYACTPWGPTMKPRKAKFGDSTLNLERNSVSFVLSLLEIFFSMPYTSGMWEWTACRGRRWRPMRHISGTNWHKLGVKAEPRRRVGEVKWGISILLREILQKFFLYRNNFTPKGPGLGQTIELKRPVGPKNRGIFITCNLHWFTLFYFPKVQASTGFFWIFRGGAGPASIFVPRNLHLNYL